VLAGGREMEGGGVRRWKWRREKRKGKRREGDRR
jgi:hypothetical protein